MLFITAEFGNPEAYMYLLQSLYSFCLEMHIIIFVVSFIIFIYNVALRGINLMQEPFIFITCYIRKISAIGKICRIHSWHCIFLWRHFFLLFSLVSWVVFQSIMIMKYCRSGPQSSENFTKHRIISGIIYEIKYFYQFLTGKLIINIIILCWHDWFGYQI